MSLSVSGAVLGQTLSSSVITATSGAAGVSGDNPRLSHAAHEFEASLMKEFLKPLEQDSLFSEKSDGDSEDDDGGGSSSALMSYGTGALATAISERGGFGIAKKILDHFRTDEATSVPEVSA